jgi:hypothetical protein
MSVPTVAPYIDPKIQPGDRVRIVQRIAGRAGVWTTKAEGEVVSCKMEKTGSWYAHGKNDKLWLQRIRLRKEDGEITNLVVDQNSRIERLSPTDSPS